MADQVLRLVVTGNVSGATKGMRALQRELGSVSGNLKSFGQSMTLGVTLPIVAGGAALVKFAASAFETEQRFRVVTGKMGASMRKWSEDTAESLGLNAYALRGTASDWYVYTKNLGISEEAAAKMSESLTILATDIASFRDISLEEAQQKLLSGMSGEMEAVRRWGIDVSDAAVKAEGLRLKMVKGKQEMTQAQKVQARYSIIMRQTALAQGDWARSLEAGSPTVKLKSLQERATELGVAYGQILLPSMSKLIDAGDKLLKMLERLNPQQREMALSAAGIAAAIGPLTWIVGGLVGAFNGLISLFGAFGQAAIVTQGSVYSLYGALAALQARLTQWQISTASNKFADLATKMGMSRNAALLLGKALEYLKAGPLGILSLGITIAFKNLNTSINIVKNNLQDVASLLQWISNRKGASLGAIASANRAASSYNYSTPARPHALGGVFSTPHVGLVAEAGPEAIIPLNNRPRSYALLAEANRRMGMGGAVVAAPSVNITVHADSMSDKRAIYGVVQQALADASRGGRALSLGGA